MLKKLRLLFLVSSITGTIQAQSEEFIFKNYDTQNGLCDNNINSITEDQKGFIWIGTKEGLSRFDGAEFRNFHDSGNYLCLNAMGNDTLLLVHNYKLALLNTAKNRLQPVKAFAGIEIIEITKLNERLYALNAVDRLILIDNHLNRITDIKIKGKIYNNLFIRKLTKNRFLIGNCFDYYEYDLKTKSLKPCSINMRKYQDENDDLFEMKFIDEKQQEIYINDYFTGLYVFDYKGHLLRHYHKNFKDHYISSTNIISFVKDKQDAVWMATHNGINIFSKGKNTIIQHRKENDLSLKGNAVTTFFLDKNNNLWIGTNQGISVYKNKLNSKIGKISVTNDHDVVFNTIAFSDKTIYAGEYLDKIYTISSDTKALGNLKTKTRVWGLYPIGNTIAISGANPNKEVETYYPQTHTFEQTDFLKNNFNKTDIITLVFRHSNGDYWYSGNAGGGFVRKLAQSKHTITYYKNAHGAPMFKSSYYSMAVEDADKNLWFGVNRSELLLQWNYKTNRFREINFSHLKKLNKPIFGGITGLKIDKNNIIWISYEGSGIIKFNPKTNAVRQYTIASGLNTNIINDIEFDDAANLWILSGKGISCLDTKTEKIYQMDIWDGFTDDPMNYNMLKMNPKTRTMWIGAVNNLYYFHPDEVLKNKRSNTNLYLDYLKINDEKTIDQHVLKYDFKPNENNLEFRLVAIDLENGKNLEYSYQLNGLSNQWYNLESNRTIYFQKLKAGTYSFNARVRNKGSKDWVYLASPITFSIAENWYETWWFFVLLGLALFYVAFRIISFYFDRKLEKQQNEIEKQKLIEEERKRIAKDMHDDLGSGLTKITYLSQMAMQNQSSAEQHLSNINKTSIELVESMSEIIWMMKDENNSWEELLVFVKRYAVDYCSNNDLNVIFDFPESPKSSELSGEKRRHIYLSIKEILHNVIKHAKAKNVTIGVTQNHKTVILIKDDGIGIALQNNESAIGGNGLKNIRDRMQQIKGEVFVKSIDGTEICLVIPN